MLLFLFVVVVGDDDDVIAVRRNGTCYENTSYGYFFLLYIL